MAHDIIDNRNEKLVENIELILSTSERARFAVGYLFLSGLKPIRKELEKLKELRLLIGNTTNRETIETLAEGYKRLELLNDVVEGWQYPKRTAVRQSIDHTAENLRDTLALMDQTDEDEDTIKTVLRLIEEKRLKLRVYTKGRLHAKAYIFDYGQVYTSSEDDVLLDLFRKPVSRKENGIAIVGSSNLTLSGISHNTELNIVVSGNQNHAELVHWFDELWDESQDFSDELMQEIGLSWAVGQQSADKKDLIRPYDVYMKTLYELVKERLEEDRKEVLWQDSITQTLADFQKVAVRQAIQMIRKWRGCFVADVVGLGKSYIGTAVVKHFERIENARPLIICPAGLVEMWERYNEIYQLNARVLSQGLLRESDDDINFLLSDLKYRDRDFVLVDESHNFRNSNTQRYRLLQGFLNTGRRCLFLTATPRNKSLWDVYNQIKLFHPGEQTDLPIDPPDLKKYFREIEKGNKQLPDLLVHLLIRRTRNHILRWYGFDSETDEVVDASRFNKYLDGTRQAYIMVGGKKRFFPKRELETVTYSIESAYQGIYKKLRSYLGYGHIEQTDPLPDRLTYARYGLWHYVNPKRQKRKPYTDLHQAGSNLRGLIRVMLFKRLESSIHAFRETLRRMLRIHKDFLIAIDSDVVPAGEEAQKLLYESDQYEETELIDALREVGGKYKVKDFRVGLLKKHINQDIEILTEMLSLVEPIEPENDAKLQRLISLLSSKNLKEGKRLIFTQYADTARYLYENLNPGIPGVSLGSDIDVIYSGDKSIDRVVGRFAPKANPWYKFRNGESELMTVIATDVLSEGLNLQDCNKVINYDLHWNPVRLIQRFGRIDRIGSEHETIFAFNFLPEVGIEKQLGLQERLKHRIAEIHETIGEDAAILDKNEQVNEEAMFAIYEEDGTKLSQFEGEEEKLLDLNEAEELLRQMRQNNPVEFERIANLRDGIRSGLKSVNKGIFAFFRAGSYHQLTLLDEEGEIVSRDMSETVSDIQCDQNEPAQALPSDYNSTLMKAKRKFAEDAKLRLSKRNYTASLSLGQRYVVKELKALFESDKDEDTRGEITVLEEAFRGAITSAVKKELNLLRRNGVTGDNLLGGKVGVSEGKGDNLLGGKVGVSEGKGDNLLGGKVGVSEGKGDNLLQALKKIYFQHRLSDQTNKPKQAEQQSPRIVCSMALV